MRVCALVLRLRDRTSIATRRCPNTICNPPSKPFFAGKNVFVLLWEAFVSLADMYMPEIHEGHAHMAVLPRY
jgi:hypothetical protein